METLIKDINTLEDFHRAALSRQIAFVTYQLPASSELITLIQQNSQPLILNNILDLEGKSGFVFAPFSESTNFPIRLIQPDITINGNNFTNAPLILNEVLSGNEVISKQNNRKLHQASFNEYIKQVDELKEEMSKGKLEKLVLSRVSIEKIPNGFNPTIFLKELKESHPNAFVFMLHIAGAGLWFGASPEPLLRINMGIVSTVSLAGTRNLISSNKLVQWNDKELEEQQIVTGYIENVLKQFNVNNYTKKGPITQPAGNIEHLLTQFTFSISALKGKTYNFLKVIHPTPAVCGLPKDLAMKLISSTEKHEREYYSGFLGPVSSGGECNLFVNLRCMRVEDDSLVYFIGAGITAGSNPEKEWEETNNKKKTLMRIVESLKV